MEIWLLLILLGLISYLSYFLLKRSLSKITKTPAWLLWLVMMTPPIIWVSWTVLFGKEKSMPLPVAIVPFIVCPVVYWWLIQRKRIRPEANQQIDIDQNSHIEHNNPEETPTSTPNPQKPPQKLRPITSSEESALRNCFPWGVYYLQRIDYRPQAILCLGKLKAVPEVAYNTIKKNVEKVFEDRYLVVFQESFQGQPFFALVPNAWAKSNKIVNEPLARPDIAIALLLLTLLSTTIFGLEFSQTEVTLEQVVSNPKLLAPGLYYSLGIIAILGIHELGHYLTAISYRIRATLPYFIPFPFFLGTFGAFVQMRSPIPHRKALFDIAIAGPVAGFLVSLPILIWGLSLSEVVPIPEDNNLFNFNALDPRFSLLLSLLSKFALGSQLLPNMAIDLHPAAIAGYIGLIFTALNLMPVGQLDGGHIVHAVFGQRSAAIIGQVTLLLTLGLAFVQRDFFLWAIFLLFMPAAQPALNDITELDNWRDLLGLLALGLLVCILLPLPGTLAQWLNI
ncbi:MAG: site-2 protease family protein [Prochloraceae cyanobacterium]|nr:site-2 protease family protein [Prochloraceae cyanobacterium]